VSLARCEFKATEAGVAHTRRIITGGNSRTIKIVSTVNQIVVGENRCFRWISTHHIFQHCEIVAVVVIGQ
jgi:hypothetical protein